MSASLGTAAGPTALVVEDEAKLAVLLCKYLEAAGYATHRVADGRQVVSRVRQTKPSVILLDLMLPGRDGTEICQELRTFTDTPIVIVSARVEEADRLRGLGLGADDYICKPFSPREVVARVKAIMRRTASPATSQECTLLIDPHRHTVAIRDRSTALTAIELRLLQLLCSAPGRVFSRTHLIDKLYADDRAVTERAVDSHIKNLRKKLEQLHPEQTVVESVYGAGYRLTTEIRAYEQL